MEKTFHEAWLEVICRDTQLFNEYGEPVETRLAFKSIARSFGVEEDDLRQEVAIWFSSERADLLEAHVVGVQEDINYLVKTLNNQAKRIGAVMQLERFDSVGNYYYSKDEVKRGKFALAANTGTFTLAGSDAHAIQIDFDNAIKPLTQAELEVFLTPPAEYPEDPKANAAIRRKVSKLTDRVWRRMNQSAFNGSKVIDE